MASSCPSGRGASLQSIFQDLSQNINLVLAQIRDGEVTKEDSDSFSPDQYWNSVDGIFKKVSVETTKLSLAFSKGPFPSPQNTDTMVIEIEKAMLSLASIFFTLPLTQGKVLRRTFQHCVARALESLHYFSEALMECVNSKGDSQRLTWTGSVWQASQLALMKDNKTCVLKELSNTEELVQDAMGEIEEAKESEGRMDALFLGGEGEEEEGRDGDGGAVWSSQDRTVIEACTGMVKMTKTVVKKCRLCVNNNGSVASREEVAILDALVDRTSQVSEHVDHFVSAIYVPVNYQEIKNYGRNLADLAEEILNFLQSCSLTNNSDASWIDFLHKAANHNMEKLQKSTLPDQGHG